jgi:hypothetical protein
MTPQRYRVTTADWRQYDIEVGYLFEEFNHDGTLSGNHEGIVERMDAGGRKLPRQAVSQSHRTSTIHRLVNVRSI